MDKITPGSGWVRQDTSTTRGGSGASGSGPRLAGLPDEFLTPASAPGAVSVLGEAVLRPDRPATTRGEVAPPPGPLTLDCEVGPGESAVLAVRHPSGALTFHVPTSVERRTTRGAGTGRGRVQFTVPISTRAAGTTTRGTRGLIDTAIKAVVIKVVDKIADKAIDTVMKLALPLLARAFERIAWQKQGLKEGWLAVTKDTLSAGKLTARTPTSSQRSLLFIHGTFSNTASAFKSLAGSSFFDDVADTYGDRIFGFDHFTVSKTPEENAGELLKALPRTGCTFDVITHSRGGLVLRNIVERASTFGELGSRFRLGRAVLVAAPNDGTPLATPRRWEETVGWMANLLEMFPDNPFTTGSAFVADAIVWMARHASGDLPGLHAMDVDGDPIEQLQLKQNRFVDAYSALVANYHPDAQTLQRLLDVGIDQFFGSANDLVVPTAGGWQVARLAPPFIAGARIGCYGPGGNLPGGEVTHVNIFSQPHAAEFLVSALASKPHNLALVNPARQLPDRRALRSGGGLDAERVSSRTARPPLGGRRAAADRKVEPAAEPTLQVTVVNGDLSFERLPLMVGHYQSSKLTGAEKLLNQLTHGAMKRSLDLGTYPMAPGSSEIFVNTLERGVRGPQPRPAAVIVVGLGQEGSLRPGDLSYTVRQAVLCWAQRLPDTTKSIELAATLIASGGTGISPGQSAQLIVQGVLEANEVLADGSGEDPKLPLVSQLRLIELYGSRSGEAWRALKLQAATQRTFTVKEPIAEGTGSLPRPLDAGYRGADYDFVSVSHQQDKKGTTFLQYALDTHRARTEVRAHATQTNLLRDLVATASNDQVSDHEIGRTLFKLLVPIELESFLSGSRETQLEVDEDAAGIPWELLDDADGSHGASGDQQSLPWAIRVKLLRKLKTEVFRDRVLDADGEARVLVVGEPACPPEYPRLPGAFFEAQTVADCFIDHGHERSVKALLGDGRGQGPNSREVLNALLNNDWRVIHIAGHGAPPEPDKGTSGGVVLSKDKTFLGAAEIKAMRVTPELVFVNCCHVGAITSLSAQQTTGSRDFDRARFASGVAEELIRIGVRCVVAAGWAVEDQAASVFAETFYRELLNGRRFLDAVATAREAAFRVDGGGNTWAAYQCYGDPDWRLRRTSTSDAPTKAHDDEFDDIGSIRGLELALDTLIVQSESQDKDPKTQEARLRLLEARWSKMRWRASDGVGERFARAYAVVGRFDEAVRWFDAAIAEEDSKVALRALEDRSNMRIRHAWHVFEGTKPGEARTHRVAGSLAERRKRAVEARSIIKAEVGQLEQLLALGETAGRRSLLGSAYKRLAMVEGAVASAGGRQRALDSMLENYGRALELLEDRDKQEAYYPLVNLLAGHVAAANGRSTKQQTSLNRLFARATQSLEARRKHDDNFWSAVGEIDLRLLRAVATAKASGRFAAGERQAIKKGYRDLKKRHQGRNKWMSEYDSAWFVLGRLLEQQPSRGAGKNESAPVSAAREILDLLWSNATQTGTQQEAERATHKARAPKAGRKRPPTGRQTPAKNTKRAGR